MNRFEARVVSSVGSIDNTCVSRLRCFTTLGYWVNYPSMGNVRDATCDAPLIKMAKSSIF